MAMTRCISDMKLVGEGRTAEIYHWDEERVLRLYRCGAHRTWVLHEFTAFQAVNSSGIPSPMVYPDVGDEGLVEVDGRIGFVMDRIDGVSMLRELATKPWKMPALARLLAELHADIHQRVGDQLPSQRSRFRRILESLRQELGSSVIDAACAVLDRLPDGNAICHGDFHPDNVILTPNGPVVIDWGPASCGRAAADVAWTAFLFRHGGVPPGTAAWERFVMRAMRRIALAIYRRRLRRCSSIDWREVEAWEPVIAAVRYRDGILEEQPILRVMLDRAFGSGRATGP